MLPQVRELERRFPDVLAMVGVHSGKFIAERETAAVAEAVVRLGVHHPVVNDRQFRVWRSHAVRGWPTLILLDPAGYVVHQHFGEASAAQLGAVIEALVEDAEGRGILRRGLPPLAPEAARARPAVAPGALRYPGKLAVDGTRIAIADTGHHRVLVGTLEAGGRRARLTTTVGGAAPGYADGSFASATFREPQGLAFAGDRLYVADAGSHAVRVVELEARRVRTLAGTGERVRTRAGLEAGGLASPWDVAVVDGTVYVAMAGLHQLYAIDAATGAARPHAGSRAEALHDAPLAAAALAQPMGLVAGDGALWFADAESSAVRRADLAADGRVGTIVGTGLFDFGDRDGAGDDVRLQHPQGIARAPDGRLLVADSYNGALKWIDPAARTSTTWIGGLHEPTGVALLHDDVALVADTNAHRLVRVEGLRVEEVELVVGEEER